MNDPAAPDTHLRWPRCQNLALPTTEPGTWSVSYTYGQAPPTSGVLAAKQLACELYTAVAGGTCVLPTGTTRVTRQGVTVDRVLFKSWGMKGGEWATGMILVDAFLNAFNPEGHRRAPAVWSPDVPAKPRHTGE
jgi:hypothetical protein